MGGVFSRLRVQVVQNVLPLALNPTEKVPRTRAKLIGKRLCGFRIPRSGGSDLIQSAGHPLAVTFLLENIHSGQHDINDILGAVLAYFGIFAQILYEKVP